MKDVSWVSHVIDTYYRAIGRQDEMRINEFWRFMMARPELKDDLIEYMLNHTYQVRDTRLASSKYRYLSPFTYNSTSWRINDIIKGDDRTRKAYLKFIVETGLQLKHTSEMINEFAASYSLECQRLVPSKAVILDTELKQIIQDARNNKLIKQWSMERKLTK
jgi:hypothetical protein